MRFFKHPILISLVLFAAVAYAPASHLVAYDNSDCPQDAPMSAQ